MSSSFSTLSGSARLQTAKSEAKAASKLPPKPKSAAVKYDSAKSVVDTGSSINKIKEKEASKNFVVGKNEIFKRIRTKRLAEYIEAEGGWEVEATLSPQDPDLRPPPTASEALNPRDDGPKPNAPRRHDYSYLLLDLRDKEDFDKCRIRGALHYPLSMLSRSTNEFLPEMYSYKNKENKLIVVYDVDESIAQKAATTLIQKGIDNIYLLSGGLFDMNEKFPEHVIGTLPPKPGTAKLSSSGRLTTSGSLSSSSRPTSTTSSFSTSSGVSRATTISKTSISSRTASPSVRK
eukprot:TRINITY_DN3702_c0_g1_i1.p1 TRINITY_DN3702_c0_g1~~TRINITY_DN3702_c0_g1_i1.p1  ORF type:complete len:290 (-),score=69.52 TRINITY_DN3702_c0_g1_i1:340-1209(-)